MMKFCPYCGTERLSEEAVFCMGCGKRLPDGKSKPARREERKHERKPERKKQSKPNDYESEDLLELYAGEHIDDTVQDEYVSDMHEEVKQYAPPVRKKRKPVDDYDGYYDDVIPYDKGKVREDNILELAKKVFMIIIAALIIVAICVVMMYVL